MICTWLVAETDVFWRCFHYCFRFHVTMPAHAECDVSSRRQLKKQPAAKQQPGHMAATRTQHNTTAGQPPTAQVRLHMCAAMARQHHVRAIAAAFRSRGGKGRSTPPHLGLQVAGSATLQIGALPAEQATAPLCTERLPEPPARALLPVAPARRSWQAAIRIAYVPVTETALPARSWD